jgi:hypothetical protein
MRFAGKLFLFVATALAALAMTASAASAVMEVLEEDGDHCPAVTLVAHVVSGGCDVEYRGEHHVVIVAYTPAPVVFTNCNLHLDAQIGEDGSGHVTAAALTAETVNPPLPGCVRAACDEATGQMLPWPLTVREVGGVEVMEMTLCLRTISSGPGGPQTRCEIHLPFLQGADHNHEVGDSAEYFCEVAAIPTSFHNVHLINEVPAGQSAEDIALVH